MKIIIALFVLLATASSLVSQPVPFVENGKVGYIDSTGKILLEPTYDTPVKIIYIVFGNDSFPSFELPDWAYFSEDKASVRIDNKLWFITYRRDYAVINPYGDLIFAPGPNLIHSFNDGLAVYSHLQKSANFEFLDKMGVIDKDGKWVLIPVYEYISQYKDGMALTTSGDKYFYIDKDGERAFDASFADAGLFNNGVAPARNNALYGYINKKGEWIVPESFEYAWQAGDGAARFLDKGLYGFLRISEDNDIIKMEKIGGTIYSFANDFSDGLACVQDINGMFGYIDLNGKYHIEPTFSHAKSFSEGLAAVRFEGKFGYINKSGEFIVVPIYDFAENFYNGIAKVWQGKQMLYINKNGKVIRKFNFRIN